MKRRAHTTRPVPEEIAAVVLQRYVLYGPSASVAKLIRAATARKSAPAGGGDKNRSHEVPLPALMAGFYFIEKEETDDELAIDD